MTDNHAEMITELAKTTRSGIEALSKFSSFFAPIARIPIEAVRAIWEPRLAYMQAENFLIFMERYNALLEKHGIPRSTRVVPLKFGIPLINAAILENDELLRDAWAKLLINATDADSGIEMRRAYIDILENLTSLDVKNLTAIYPALPDYDAAYLAAYLPDKLVLHENNNKDYPDTPRHIDISLHNLHRLGCVHNMAFWGSKGTFTFVKIAALGEALVEACTLRNNG